jgi:hypothetical protein
MPTPTAATAQAIIATRIQPKPATCLLLAIKKTTDTFPVWATLLAHRRCSVRLADWPWPLPVQITTAR